jgi:hypothetical protein
VTVDTPGVPVTDARVSVLVMDQNNAPLVGAGASITIPGVKGKKGVVAEGSTNADGLVVLTVPFGYYTLIVDAPSYGAVERSVDVLGDVQIPVTLTGKGGKK